MFIFQAEDGIRDGHVTGVQTCALPISVELADVAALPLVPMIAVGYAVGARIVRTLSAETGAFRRGCYVQAAAWILSQSAGHGPAPDAVRAAGRAREIPVMALAVPQSAAPLNAGAHGFRSPVGAQYGTPPPGLHAVALCVLEPLRCGAPALGGTPLPGGGTGRGASVEHAHGEQCCDLR